ncbi:MAG: hypothetical protein ACLUPL_15565 [Butyricimonas virosa]
MPDTHVVRERDWIHHARDTNGQPELYWCGHRLFRHHVQIKPANEEERFPTLTTPSGVPSHGMHIRKEKNLDDQITPYFETVNNNLHAFNKMVPAIRETKDSIQVDKEYISAGVKIGIKESTFIVPWVH